METHTKIISVYSTVKGLGKTKYVVNLAAGLSKLTGKKTIIVDRARPSGDILRLLKLEDRQAFRGVIDSQLGMDVSMGDSFDINNIESLKTTYKYILVDLPLELNMQDYEILSNSDSMHFFVDSDMNTLQKAHAFLEELHEKGFGSLRSKLKIIIHKLDIRDQYSIDDIAWIVKHNVYAVVPEPGMLDVLIDLKGVPIVLKSEETSYARAILYIAKSEADKILGLALGSGAAFGLAHIGVLKVLEREHIKVDIVSGSSTGALLAAMWGLGLNSDEIYHIAERLRRKLNVMRLLDFTLPISGILAGRRLRRFLKSILGEKTFADLKIPVKIMAYDLSNRQNITVETGRLLDAVCKSIAVPGIFGPIMENDRMIIDGGVLDPVPVDILYKCGAKKIITVNVLPGPKDIHERNMRLKEMAKEEENMILNSSYAAGIIICVKRFFRKIFMPNIFDVIMTSMQAMEYELAERSCAKVDISLHPVLTDATSIDFHLVKKFVKRGEDEAMLHINKIRNLVS